MYYESVYCNRSAESSCLATPEEAMTEPVKMADFFITFFSAASVIVFGALYALLFAYARIKKVPRIMPLAYASYAVLFVSVLELANMAHLYGSVFWIFVVLLMLAGYLAAPHAIWHLCVGTHAATDGCHTFRNLSKEKAS